MGYLKYKGYSGSVEYDESVQFLTGKVLGIKRDCILYEGTTVSEIKKDFEDAVDDYLAHCAAMGIEPEKPYSGKTVIRMGSKLHEEAAAKAHEMGISLNDLITKAIVSFI